MIALLIVVFVAGTAFGWSLHMQYVRRMWRLARRFRNAAMGGKRGDF